MAVYPIKMMKDESGQPFVPLTSLDAVIGEKNLQYILDAEELSAGHFRVNFKDLEMKDITNSIIVVRWPQITSTVKPSYLKLNNNTEAILYDGTGKEYMDLEDASGTINLLAYDGTKWIQATGSGSGGGHVITDGEGHSMEQQKVLSFVGFNVENDAANRATKIVNPTPINNLTTTESGQGSLDAYQGNILSKRSVPAGGTKGQVLAKSGNGDHQLEWINQDSDDVVTSDGSIEEIIGLTYEEYKALEAAGNLKATTQYHITDLADQGITFLTEAEVQDMIKNKVNINQTIKEKNLDDYNTTGFFYCNACTNSPGGGTNGYMFAQSYGAEYCYQRYIKYQGGSTYERFLVGGTWQQWYEVTSRGGWVDLEVMGGWSAYEGQNPPQIRRIGKHVQLRGLLLATAETDSRYAFVIPEDMRPTIVNNLYYSITVANNNTGSNKRAEMAQITTDGRLLTFGTYEEADWFGLEGISWFID